MEPERKIFHTPIRRCDEQSDEAQMNLGMQIPLTNMEQQNAQFCTVPDYVPPIYQTDPMAGYQNRLDYKMASLRLDLEKEQASFEQRLMYEQKLYDLKLQYKMFLELISCTVYRDSAGRMMVSFTKPDNVQIISKPMLNVRNFRSVLFTSYYPHPETVLGVCWDETGSIPVCFRFGKGGGISPDAFAKRLKAKGILFLVSGKSQKMAAEALLAYAIENASMSEILFFHGWGKTKKGTWHFARKDEITMQEVLKNV